MLRNTVGFFVLSALTVGSTAVAKGRSFGVEMHNTVIPASGGMGGVGIARPQDLPSAINANPASLTQFRGTQFAFSGVWAEPTFNLTQTSNLPVIGPDPLIKPYSARSTAVGVAVGDIGVTEDLSEPGFPAVLGIGFITTAGACADFRHVPASNGTHNGLTIFNMPAAFGVDLTERLSIGPATIPHELAPASNVCVLSRNALTRQLQNSAESNGDPGSLDYRSNA